MSHLQLLQNFQENALQYLYFNIDRKYFQDISLKSTITELFQENWFKNQELKQFKIEKNVDLYNINIYINELYKSNEKLISRLFHYPLKRTGNGEIMLYLFLENSYLDLSSKSGKDIIINNEHFEIKHVKKTKKYNSGTYFYNNFKLGYSVTLRNVTNNIENYFSYIPKGSEMQEKRNQNDLEFLKIEQEYREIAYAEYFEKHNVIFINDEYQIEFVGKIQKEQIFIDTITEGTIKPMILI